MEVLPQTKLGELLHAHPELQDWLEELAPPFRNLQNPVLRRTVARVATLARAAQVGGLEPLVFVNLVRRRLGQPELSGNGASSSANCRTAPPWVKGSPRFLVDAEELLSKGEVPLAEVVRLAKELGPGEHLAVRSGFAPAPLADALAKAGFHAETVRDPHDLGGYLTYVSKGDGC
ncbi:MAG: DUF1858 domain-containing protein [Fimbriimonadales bacterium]